MKLSDKVYQALKWIALTLIPTLTWALNLLLPLWGVSDDTTKVVVTTIAVLGTVIGALIGVSTINYNKGQ